MSRPVLKPVPLGSETPPTSVVSWARTTPTTAADTEVPTERIPDTAGGTARTFDLTDAGRERLDRERRMRLAGLRDILGEWEADDVVALATLLRRSNDEVERRNGRPWPRTD